MQVDEFVECLPPDDSKVAECRSVRREDEKTNDEKTTTNEARCETRAKEVLKSNTKDGSSESRSVESISEDGFEGSGGTDDIYEVKFKKPNYSITIYDIEDLKSIIAEKFQELDEKVAAMNSKIDTLLNASQNNHSPGPDDVDQVQDEETNDWQYWPANSEPLHRGYSQTYPSFYEKSGTPNIAETQGFGSGGQSSSAGFLQHQNTPAAVVHPPHVTPKRAPGSDHDSLCSGLGISPNLVKVIKNQSSSRKNFAANLVCHSFSHEERKTSNCSGVRGKKPLNPRKLDLVKSLVYQNFPLPAGQEIATNWKKECIAAIDEKNRRKPKPE